MPHLEIETPAPYVSLQAIAFGSVGAEATPVDAAHPLPVAQTPLAATSTPLAGSTSSTGVLGPFTPQLGRPIVLSLSGTWTGSVQVKRSVDGGATKLALTAAGSAWASFTGNCCEAVWEESESGAEIYLDVTLASGTLTYRVAQ